MAKVVLDDGSRIDQVATIQTVCRGRRTYTDSHGGFSFYFGDGWTASAAGIGSRRSIRPGTRVLRVAEAGYFRDCELRAELPGFTSQAVDLASRMSTFETTDIGASCCTALARC